MPDSLLSAAAVEVRYPGAAGLAVDDVSLSVHAAQAIGIVGESGSGKSTFARVLAGLLPATAGRVTVEGRQWSEIRRTDTSRRRVQMVFQDPVASLNPYHTAHEAVAEVCRVWTDTSRRASSQRARELLQHVGIPSGAQDRKPRHLSGGQCQRVVIARALACEPAVLIADEPTSSLDVSVQAQILNLISDLRQEHALALVLISHDLAVVRHMTDTIHVMYRGKFVEDGMTESVFTRPSHEYTKALLEAALPAGSSSRGHVDYPPTRD